MANTQKHLRGDNEYQNLCLYKLYAKGILLLLAWLDILKTAVTLIAMHFCKDWWVFWWLSIQ